MSAPNGRTRVFEGAVAIITGGASGIGKALAQELARRGGDVILADLHFDAADEAARNIRAAGGKASAHQLDVTDFQATDKLVQTTFSEKGRLDYMFNNAGICLAGDVRDHELDDWDRILDVNVRGVVHGVQAAYPRMIQQGFGHLVNTASIAGLLTSPSLASYAASKHAIVGLSKSLRVEAEQFGVRVSILCPGLVQTPMLAGGPSGTLIKRMHDGSPNIEYEKLRVIGPDRFAVRALNAIARNRAIIVIPSKWKVLWWIERLSPTLSLWLGKKLHRLEQTSPQPAGKTTPELESVIHS